MSEQFPTVIFPSWATAVAFGFKLHVFKRHSVKVCCKHLIEQQLITVWAVGDLGAERGLELAGIKRYSSWLTLKSSNDNLRSCIVVHVVIIMNNK